MRKQAPIEKGSDVYYLVKPIEEACWVMKIHAKVLDVNEEIGKALIEIDTEVTYGSPKINKTVLLSELENKRYVIDEVEAESRRIKQFEKAEKVAYFDGHLYAPDYDEYFWDVEDYLEKCDNDDTEPLEYLYCTTVEPIDRIDAGYFEENILENYCDDYEPDIKGLDELQKAIDTFY